MRWPTVRGSAAPAWATRCLGSSGAAQGRASSPSPVTAWRSAEGGQAVVRLKRTAVGLRPGADIRCPDLTTLELTIDPHAGTRRGPTVEAHVGGQRARRRVRPQRSGPCAPTSAASACVLRRAGRGTRQQGAEQLCHYIAWSALSDQRTTSAPCKR